MLQWGSHALRAGSYGAPMTGNSDYPFDVEPPELTPEDRADRKRVADRRRLLDHVERVRRMPAWVYRDMEAAIACAIAGAIERAIECGDGRTLTAAELMEVWELDRLIEVYRRPADHDEYEGGYAPGW